MKKRNQEKVAKIFAFVVVLIMILQVLLPLFSSGNLNPATTIADITSTTTEQTVPVTAGTPNSQVSVSTTTPGVVTIPAQPTK